MPADTKLNPRPISAWNQYLVSLCGKKVIVLTSDAPPDTPIRLVGESIETLKGVPSVWRGTLKMVNVEHPNCVVETADGEVTLFNVVAIVVPKAAANA